MSIVFTIIGLLVLREIAAYIFGWSADWFGVQDAIEIRKHNAKIEKQWRKNGRPIVATTMGWRPDPWQNEDGMKSNGDGSYSRLIRGGTPEYKKKFAEDVEQASKEWQE